jgi:hypothetical protein
MAAFDRNPAVCGVESLTRKRSRTANERFGCHLAPTGTDSNLAFSGLST